MNKNYITRIFLVDDDEMYGYIIKTSLEENENYDVRHFLTGEEAIQNINEDPDVVIIDYSMPGMSGLDVLKKIKEFDQDIGTIILSGQEKVEVVVEAYNSGANNYLIKGENAIFELKHILKNLSNHSNLRKEVMELRDEIIDRNKYNRIIGESKPILNILKLIQKVEKTNLTTLITGDSGTGKELVAKAIHYNSPRRKKAFVPVNLAAIPVDLIESELFGHEKGAFTGATSKRIGKFEEANGGTIFLDEIGEMALDLQAKLLRVLEDSRISRLGSNKEIKLDIRVLSATNKNLSEQVKENKFREDLMYRLQGFLIHLVPLKDRENDVILLANRFLNQFSDKNKLQVKSISKDAISELLRYPWPGNIRELKSVIERAALLCETEKIEVDNLIFN